MSDDEYEDYVAKSAPAPAKVTLDIDPAVIVDSAGVSTAVLDRNAIRKQSRAAGVELGKTPDDRLDGLLLTCRGDVDLAITAATLDPRPGWVELHIGKRVVAKPTNMTR